jgi:squalene-hopene/tetraprenyl-beta-curcumene cyclase
MNDRCTRLSRSALIPERNVIDRRAVAADALPLEEIAEAVKKAATRISAAQHPSGCWCFPLEADCTIPAEYVIMMHYMGEADEALQAKIAVYLRARQNEGGGWPLFYGGPSDISCSVKCYMALKLAGDRAEQPHMARARQCILELGGAARCNVFTRITLALFEQVPWRAVPFIPVEIILLPRWFPFHLDKVSYWSRTVMVPLLILCSRKPRARNPHGISIAELFTHPPGEVRDYFPVRSRLNHFFLFLDRLGRGIESLIPPSIRRRAYQRAEDWILERRNGVGGLGAIFPAMINAFEALDCLGYPADHPFMAEARQALKDLLVIGEESAYCQPCTSPVWDTALTCLTLFEVGTEECRAAGGRGLAWLATQQLLDAPGDWQRDRPSLKGGGWAFQFQNPHYADLDDTSAVICAMLASGDENLKGRVLRATEWVLGMQSRNGGFASFDSDNNHAYLNEIPFADHGALLDPPTSDISGRCVMLLAQLLAEHPEYGKAFQECLKFLDREQEPDGSWFGRWGTNYIYGTWSVLIALEKAGIPADDPRVRRAVAWLKSVQREDGSWGEDNESYYPGVAHGVGPRGTSFQTAWALLALLAAGEAHTPAVRRGIEYLLRSQRSDGGWEEPDFTAPGFPRVFYLKYHGYSKYFPLWALARYRNLVKAR